MKKALNAWSVPESVAMREMFASLKRAGFEGVELNVDAENAPSRHALSLATDARALADIRALSEEYALPVCSISSSLWGDLLARDDPSEAKRLLEKQLECAEALGADGILVVPGGISAQRSILRAWEKNQASIEALRPVIEHTRVKVGLENVWNNFFISPFDMARFLDEMNMKNLGAYFDVGNVLIFSYPEHWIEILASRIVKIHVKDFAKAGGNAGHFVNLLEGSANWKAVTKSLRSAGYDGYLTAELGAMPETPEYLYEITSKALDIIINTEENAL